MRAWPITLFFLLVSVLVLAPSAPASNPRQVTTSPSDDRHPSWTADGQFIVFESNRNGSFQIHKIPAAGGTAIQLTFGYSHTHPEVSPDGTTVAFLRSGVSSSLSIWTMPVNGGEPFQVTPASTQYIDWEPSWSPDGQTIHFSRRNLGDWDVYKVAASGGPGTPLYTAGNSTVSHVSPDGQRYAFALVVNGAYNTVEAPISNPTSLTQLTFETSNTAAQDYSPDGSKILLSSSKDTWQELWELDRATLNLTQLTFDGAQTGIQPLNNPAQYSPDGTKVVFGSRRITGDYNIWILDLAEPPGGENILTVGDGRGLPGGETVEIVMSLESVQSSRGLEFEIVDTPDWLNVVDIQLTGRASNLQTSFLDDGDLHVLIYGAVGEIIPPGIGEIAKLELAIDANAAVGDSVEFAVINAILSDVAGEAAPLETRDGRFDIARMQGDVTGNNSVDVGDLVRLIEIILGTAAPPVPPEELDAADCNSDEAHDILDVICLVDIIIGGSSAPRLELLSFTAASDLVVHVESEVRGLQFTVSGGVEGTVGLSPFSMYSGVGAGGRTFVLGFDSGGLGWLKGTRVPFRVTGGVLDVKAFGPGGRPLLTSRTGNEVWIGSPPPVGFRVLPNRPNPFRGSTAIRFRTESAGPVQFAVYDVRGAQVSVFEERVFAGGEHVVEWKAVDTYGRILPAGVYIATLEFDGNRVATRLTHLGRISSN